jgi:hypothetical protein
MAKKLWLVRIEHETVVYAEDAFDAQDAARDSLDDEDPYVEATDLRSLPSGWTGDAIPWGQRGEDEERDLRELVKAGFAPKLDERSRRKLFGGAPTDTSCVAGEGSNGQ